MNWKSWTRLPWILMHRGGKGAYGCCARRSVPPGASTAISSRMRGSRALFGGRNIVLARLPQNTVGSPAAPHAQPMPVQRTDRPSGPISASAASRGTASTGTRPTTSQSHRGVVVWTKNKHAYAKRVAVSYQSFVDRGYVLPVSLRGCLFLLFGSTLVVKIKKTQEFYSLPQ